MVVLGEQWDALNNATAKFQAEVTDPRAQVLPTYNLVLGLVRTSRLIWFMLYLHVHSDSPRSLFSCSTTARNHLLGSSTISLLFHSLARTSRPARSRLLSCRRLLTRQKALGE